MPTRSKKPKTDKNWFFSKIDENNTSVRKLARHMGIDPSAASRTFSGERQMKIEEAKKIAQFLNTSVQEVLSHAGIAINLQGEPTNILLAATIGEDGQMTGMREPRSLPQSIIDRAQSAVKGGDAKVLAAQIRAAKGPLSMWDDAVVLFHHTETVDADAIGMLAIVKVRDGAQCICHLDRARKTGEATLRLPEGNAKDMVILTATPVLAVIP